jgi:hypothetical protein
MRGCPIYKKLYEDIITEYKAPLKRTLEFLCKLAHYKQQADDYTINETIEAEYDNLLIHTGTSYAYKHVDDITSIDADNIQTLIFNQEATMDDKYRFKKYFLKCQFLEGAEDEQIETPLEYVDALAYIFDKQLLRPVQQIVKLINNKDNLFNKIMDFNGLDSIFPESVKKTKLNDDIKKLIFDNFTFKYLKSSSSDSLIIKEVYNVFFSPITITTSYDGNNHTQFNIETRLWSDIYNFVDNYYRLPNTINTISAPDAELMKSLMDDSEGLYKLNHPKK